MLRRYASNYLAPVPSWTDTTASRGLGSAPRAPSAVSFIAVTLLAAIALILSLVLIVTAPSTVTIPLGIVFVVGVIASTLAMRWDRRGRRRDRRRRAYSPPSLLRTIAAREPVGFLHGESGADRRGVRWGAVGAVSMVLLVSALVVPEGVGILLMAIGLAGLMMFRLAAMSRGWAPRGVSSVHARAPVDSSPPGGERHAPRWRSDRDVDSAVGRMAASDVREMNIDDALEMTFPASDPPAWSSRTFAAAGRG